MRTSLSRSPRSPLFGKREIPHNTKLSFSTTEGMARLAHASGMTKSEWIATLIEVRVHGSKEVEKILVSRLRGVAGTEQE